MGQQQLLLLVLGIVIVGMAIVGGVQIVEKNYRQHDADTLIDRSLMIAQSAVYWKAKTDPFEGGNASYTGLENGGFSRLFLGEQTDTGIFQIATAQADSLVLVAVSKRHPEVGVRITVIGEVITETEIKYDGTISIP